MKRKSLNTRNVKAVRRSVSGRPGTVSRKVANPTTRDHWYLEGADSSPKVFPIRKSQE